MSNWYQLGISEVLQQLDTDVTHGLTDAQVNHRRQTYGANELVERGRKNPWKILWEQLKAPLVVMLVIAAIISLAVGDYKNSIAIMAIVLLNAFLGFDQERKAEEAMAALKKLATPEVKVRRNGQVQEVSASELVPGDIVLLEAGNLVPADGRLLESFNLRVQEASLTGESEPIEKNEQVIFDTEQPLGDRLNMVYMGTTVTYGRSTVAIAETGMQTQLGNIANLIQTVESEPTPLQRRLEQLGKILGLIAVAIAGVIFVLGLLRGEELKDMFLTAVSLVVAAVPEGLPAVVTIALALGAKRMLKRHALIRKLPAVETLGSITTICSDKTGTLTQNRMTVTVLDVAGERLDFTNIRQETLEPENLVGQEASVLNNNPTLSLLLTSGTLCNDAVLEANAPGEPLNQAIGDPTETALVVAAARVELLKASLERVFPRIAEVPFDSERKCMTTLHQCPATAAEIPSTLASAWSLIQLEGVPTCLSFSKGAIDTLLDISSAVWVNDHIEPLNETWCERIKEAHDLLAKDGLRILAVAFRSWQSTPPDQQQQTLERDLILIGLVGMIDPARPEVKAAIQTCQTAGIRAVMITGDHPLTARHIANELGITSNGNLLTGQELNQLSIEELEEIVESVDVYARVSPEHKLNIIQALKDKGHIVAMTGDGVNDAPALKKADIGVAMGVTGTDVAKEASDVVLQDDNFATIVAAVEEGRVIYDNIRKFIKYTLTGNGGELWVILLAPFLGMPLPLEPLQILWVNLIADGMLALALSVEPAESNVMRRRPYKPNENIFGRGVGRDIVWIALVLGLGLLAVAYGYWSVDSSNIKMMQTMVFTTLAFSRMGLALALRSERDSLFKIGLLSNKPLLGVVFLTFVLQLVVLYVPFLQGFFGTTALAWDDLAICLGLSILLFVAVELEKLLLHGRKSS
ncbi:HAD-IC family P-type ATPase [Lyngbya aestuarii]|uniref:HAD-IC family P-type ATPase n=1 Tax=Lyngbya aestuarii TaxID=118322 RepID=UPI00403DA031